MAVALAGLLLDGGDDHGTHGTGTDSWYARILKPLVDVPGIQLSHPLTRQLKEGRGAFCASCMSLCYALAPCTSLSTRKDGECDLLKAVRCGGSFTGCVDTDGAATRAGLLHARGARRRVQLLSRKQIAG